MFSSDWVRSKSFKRETGIGNSSAAMATPFLPATPRTEQGYASFLGTQLEVREVIVLVAEGGGALLGYTYAGLEGIDYMAHGWGFVAGVLIGIPAAAWKSRRQPPP